MQNFIFHLKECWLLCLTHWGRVRHICVSKLTIISSDNGLSPERWNIVNLDPGNKLQWNINQNSWIFIQENTSQNVVWKRAAILSRPQCVSEYMLCYVKEMWMPRRAMALFVPHHIGAETKSCREHHRWEGSVGFRFWRPLARFRKPP